MGTWIPNPIVNTGSENDFITIVYNFIKGLWEGITCDLSGSTTKEDADASDIVFPTGNKSINIDFNLSENVVLRLQSYPSDNLAQPYSKGYNIYFIVNGNSILNIGSGKTNVDTCVNFTNENLNCRSSATRSLTFTKYVSDNVTIVWIAEYDAENWKESIFSFAKFKDANGNVKWAVNSTTDPIDTGIIKSDDGLQTCEKSNMFSYEARTGYLDFISHSSFVSGSTKVFTSTDIYDCTTVNFGDTLSLKDGANFLAIGAHSMVILDD